MREIKFRAWKTFRIPQMLDSGQFSVEWSDKKKTFEANCHVRFDSQYGMTLMQFTGLKDKNGKEIYEGDILKGNQGNFEVTFIDGAFLVIYPKGQAAQMLWTFLASNGEKEVIGNIHENPELL